MIHYLPKAFDLNVNDSYCSDHQFGAGKTSPHWHSGVEIIYVVAGKVNVMFNNSWHILEKGSMIFIPPKQLHLLPSIPFQAYSPAAWSRRLPQSALPESAD